MTEEENFETEQQIQRLLWEEYRKRDHSDSKRIRKRRRGRSQEPIDQQCKAQKQRNADAKKDCSICLETLGTTRPTSPPNKKIQGLIVYQ